MAVAQGAKPAKKAAAPKKSPPAHPPYIDMITQALVALKERTGSSHYAIAKHIEEEQKVRDLPPNFRKMLSIQLKRFVASGKLTKVKNSFKLVKADQSKPKPKPKEAVVEKKKEAVKAAKPKGVAVKPKAKATAAAAKVKSPVKKKAAAAAAKPKKVAPAKAKKPKTIKSPAKKPAAKKAKK